MSHITPSQRSRPARSSLLVLLVASGLAHADEGNRIFSFNGFGTVAMTRANTDQGDYVATRIQPNGAGRTHTWSSTDSELGGQLTATFNDQLSAVVQVVAATRINNHFSPRMEWAYVKYAPTPAINVKLGRSVLPLFMNADSSLIGFSLPSVRQPLELYSAPTTNFDGVSASWHSNFGAVSNTVQAVYGTNETKTVNPRGVVSATTKAKHMRGVNNTVEFGSWSARAGLILMDLELPMPTGRSVNVELEVANVGVSYDPGSWYVQGEMRATKGIMVASDTRSAYVTGGVRINAFTPYLLYSRVQPTGAPARVFNDQTTAAVGVRWDAIKNLAFKAQLDHISIGQGSFGTFVNVRPAISGSSTNVVTLTADFVF